MERVPFLSMLRRFIQWIKPSGPVGTPPRPPLAPVVTTDDIARHFDDFCDQYAESYGDVLQASRSSDVNELLQLEMTGMQLADGMKVLDAGCGFCGAAIWFAQRSNVSVHGITLTEKMAGMARTKVREAGLQHRIDVRTGDFHHLPEIYPEGGFDRVFFLESFGYGKPVSALARAAFDVLKPGGCIYIKDFIQPEYPEDSETGRLADAVNRRVLVEYGFRYMKKSEFLSVIVGAGFEILSYRRLPITFDPTAMRHFDHAIGSTWWQLVPALKAAGGQTAPAFELLARRPA